MSMTKLTNAQWVLAGLAAELGLDKESWKTRVNEAYDWYKSHTMEEMLEIAKEDINTVLWSYVVALQAIEKGEPVHTPVRLDWGSSGISILSCVFRDAIGLQNTSSIRVDKPLGVYGLLMEKMGLNPHDKEAKLIVKKKITLPYVYGGDSGVKHNLHKIVSFTGTNDPLVAFGYVYGSLFPSAKEAREAFLNAWDSDTCMYSWKAPDAFQCRVAIEESIDTTFTLYGAEEALVRVDGQVQKLGPITCHLGLPKATTIAKGDQGSRGIGANVVQSTDAYILRELILRGKATYLKDIFDNKVKDRIGDISMYKDTNLYQYIDIFYKTRVPSLAILDAIPKDTKEVFLPAEMYSAIAEEVKTLGKNYRILPVHDEFGVLPSKVQTLRENANRIFAGIYKSNLGAYWNEQFDMNIHINDFDQKVYEDILNSDYLIC